MVTVSGIHDVSFHVKREMIRAREAARALGAFERFLTGVLAEVACQLVGARKPPRASFPLANVRFLACVCSTVCFEVAAFRVHLAAALNVQKREREREREEREKEKRAEKEQYDYNFHMEILSRNLDNTQCI